jgi:endo-1,4-beta-D-glucanase Y
MPSRRRFLNALAALIGAALAPAGQAAPSDCDGWPAWAAFRDKFIQADGRVIDFSAANISTSEGQTYALFFSLVANDRASFDRLLEWTRANLAGGDLTARLMAWKWGMKPDGSWTVLDANAASDAELWLAYTLFQAAAKWDDRKLRATAELVLARIEKELVLDVAGVGPVLLPGPQGFALEGERWKLNPSYLPLPLLRGLAHEAPKGPWAGLIKSTLTMLDKVTPHGMAPDWMVVSAKHGFALDAKVGQVGSYDAIRVYLWAGMMSPRDPARARVLRRLQGYATLTEKLLEALGAKTAADQQRARIIAAGGVPAVYYEQALALFALGWMEKRYRFELDGRLFVRNIAPCKS